MALVNGATYRFENRADPNRSLNVYGNSPASLANVCLWTSDDDDICQQWVYMKSGSHAYLVCKGNQNLALDLYTGSGSSTVKNYNAHVYEPSATSYIEIEESDGDYIQIKLEDYSNKYLTANQGSNGTSGGKDVNAAGNVYFYNGGLTDDSQDWLPVRLDGGSDPDPDPEPGDAQYLALPLNHCTITAMYQEDSNPAYQHEWDAGGHFGLDMTGYANPFYASGDGTVVGVGGSATTGVGYWVAIRYDNVYAWNMNNSRLDIIPSIIMRYFHLASRSTLTVGQHVDLDTVIGTYGKTGQWHATMGAHLHVEVDTDTDNPLYTPTLTGAAGGLYAGSRGSGDTTFDPCTIFFIKDSEPENQTLTYSQSKCDIHPNANEYYINVAKMNKFKEQVQP